MFSKFFAIYKLIFMAINSRLVSAYRDKMAEGYKKEIQQHIIKKYRKTTDDIFMWDILAQEMG